jgi:hypothetical protein
VGAHHCLPFASLGERRGTTRRRRLFPSPTRRRTGPTTCTAKLRTRLERRRPLQPKLRGLQLVSDGGWFGVLGHFGRVGNFTVSHNP